MKDSRLPNQALGTAIKKLRAALGLTQRELASDLGFKGGEAHVSNLERGAYGVERRKLCTLLKMARGLDGQTDGAQHERELVEALAVSTSDLAVLFKVSLQTGNVNEVVTELIAEVQ